MDSAGGRGFGAGISEVGAVDRCEIVAVIASEASETLVDCGHRREFVSSACHITGRPVVVPPPPTPSLTYVAEGLVDEDHCSLGLSRNQDEVATGARYVNYSKMWWDGKRWYWRQKNRGHC